MSGAGGYDGDITSNGEMNQFPDVFDISSIELCAIVPLCAMLHRYRQNGGRRRQRTW